jgi:hypothetical protein
MLPDPSSRCVLGRHCTTLKSMARPSATVRNTAIVFYEHEICRIGHNRMAAVTDEQCVRDRRRALRSITVALRAGHPLGLRSLVDMAISSLLSAPSPATLLPPPTLDAVLYAMEAAKQRQLVKSLWRPACFPPLDVNSVCQVARRKAVSERPRK